VDAEDRRPHQRRGTYRVEGLGEGRARLTLSLDMRDFLIPIALFWG
jgi:hypothetical protein